MATVQVPMAHASAPSMSKPSVDVHVHVEPHYAANKGSEHVPATLVWSNLGVSVDMHGEERSILKDVSGYVLPGQMLAIMGPSGSGKTTLLDSLAGRQPGNLKLRGQVLLNGRKSNLSYGVSAYVTQTEELVGVLTVRETLMYSALLRLPSTMSLADKTARVDQVLMELGLTDAQHTKIGNWYLKGVSGGQRRRVCIGCELVTRPTLMFLDEPTSGLDAAAAYFVMDTIRKLAANNRTILTVIHQPSSEVFELFDQLLLLTNGHTIYFGAAQRALDWFTDAGLPCPAGRSATDHFLHVVNQDFKVDVEHADHVERNITTLTALYTNKLHPAIEQQVELHATEGASGPKYLGNVNKANYFFQIAVLTHRNLVNNWRNVGVFWIRLGMYAMLMLCIGTVYYKLGNSWQDAFSRAAMLFYVVCFLTFMSISGFPAFVEDMQIFVKERLNGYYSVSTFVIANTLAAAPFILGIAFISSAVAYWLVDLNDSGDRFPFFFLNLFMALFAVESLMMAIAAVVPHYLMGIAAGAGLLGLFMLVAGFLQPVPSLPKPVWRYPLHFIAYHSYGFAGFMHNEFDGVEGWGCPCESQASGCGAQYTPENPCTVDGQQVLDFFLSGPVVHLNKWADFAVQLAMSGGYRVIFWVLLVLKEKLSK